MIYRLRTVLSKRELRVGVYVDAFNVYYGARAACGRGTAGWRWLDLAALAKSLINPRVFGEAQVVRMNKDEAVARVQQYWSEGS